MLCGRVLYIFRLVVHMFKRFGSLLLFMIRGCMRLVMSCGICLITLNTILSICAGPAAVGYDLVEYWLGSKSRAI